MTPRVTQRTVATALGVVLVADATLVAVLIQHFEPDAHPVHAQLLAVTGTPLWLIAAYLVSRLTLSPRRAAVLVLGVGVVLSAIAMTHKPSTSDDDYRYIWDGKVQLAGVDPYRYAPSDPRLAYLRDPSLFTTFPDHCRRHFPGGCTSINRPTVHTVYPPVAEGAFTLMRILSFGGQGNHLPLQLFAALGSLAVAVLLLRRGPPWAAALWAWSPIVVVDYANNVHIDWLGVLFIVLALLVTTRTWLVGVLVGAAIAVKVYPALMLPPLMRRNWLVGVAAAAFVLLTYVPHVLAVGAEVIGFLPGYLKENDYGQGNHLLLLGPLLPDKVALAVGAVILGAVALWAWLRAPVERIPHTATLLAGVTFCVLTPTFSWYAGLLLVLVAISGDIEWLPIVVAPSWAYLVHSDHDTLGYTVAFLLTLGIAAVRYADTLRGCLRSISATTARSPSSRSTPRR